MNHYLPCLAYRSLLLVFLVVPLFLMKDAAADQYFNTYYSYKLDAIVECFGNAKTTPFCVKAREFDNETTSTIPQLYREADLQPIAMPEPTNIALEEEQAMRNASAQGGSFACLEPFSSALSCDELAIANGNMTIYDKFAQAQLSSAENAATAVSADQQAPPAILIKNLVVLIRFPEHRDRFLHEPEDFEVLFNAEPSVRNNLLIPTGSIRNFYREQSYGKINIESTIVPWVDTSITESEAASTCASLCSAARLRDAIFEVLNIIEERNLVNFAEFDTDQDGWVDAFTVITSSAAAEGGGIDDRGVERDRRVWSHKWGLKDVFIARNSAVKLLRYNVNPAFFGANPNRKQIARIGVIAHEIGHFLGLGDFYDTTGSSAGLHVYDTMASSWGVQGTQYLPNNFSPRNKAKLGIVRLKTPREGRNIIRPSNLMSDNEIYALSGTAFGYAPGETVYIDFWKRTSFAGDHPGGILIYHADERVKSSNREAWNPARRTIPHNGKHARVRLLQADGEFRLQKEPWPKRFDPDVFWNEPNLELSDFGDSNLMSWTELEKQDLSACLTTGNYLYGFKSIGIDQYEFYYKRLPIQNCYDQRPPKDIIASATTQPTNRPTKNPTKKPTTRPTSHIFQTAFPTGFPTPFPSLFVTPYPSPFPKVHKDELRKAQFPTPYPTRPRENNHFEGLTKFLCTRRVNYTTAKRLCRSFLMRLCTADEYSRQLKDALTMCAWQDTVWVMPVQAPTCLNASTSPLFMHKTNETKCIDKRDEIHFSCCDLN